MLEDRKKTASKIWVWRICWYVKWYITTIGEFSSSNEQYFIKNSLYAVKYIIFIDDTSRVYSISIKLFLLVNTIVVCGRILRYFRTFLETFHLMNISWVIVLSFFYIIIPAKKLIHVKIVNSNKYKLMNNLLYIPFIINSWQALANQSPTFLYNFPNIANLCLTLFEN